MIIKINSEIEIHTNPLEWTIQQQIQNVIEDLLKGNLTREQAEFKLKFLLHLCKYINQETGKEL